ncbi:FAD-containing oxidoreductase, partial [Streptococcus pneumoniae]|nr:FAD-containing oxidoreductase [Streptococcus pneumoniae]
FLSNKVIEIQAGDEKKELTAETIVINTGAVSNVLPIPGLATSKNIFDSTGIQSLDKLPENLGILGGGNIGLEFAGLYNKLGSKVTVLDALDTFLPRAEPSIAALAKQYMEEDGIELLQNIHTTEIKNDGDQVLVVTEDETYRFDALLYATGRKPNVEPLQLENTDIELTERGAIKVDKHCQTNVPGVFAVGDVNGGLQFTYISLDDFRVVYSYLAGDGSYTLEDRLNVPNTMFITPALSQVGLTESQAADLKLPYAVKEIPVAAMPRGHVNGDLRGAFKAVVNTETKEILGASIFSEGSQEIINIITVAMDNKIPYTYFTKQIFTHPTLAENLNDLFAI